MHVLRSVTAAVAVLLAGCDVAGSDRPAEPAEAPVDSAGALTSTGIAIDPGPDPDPTHVLFGCLVGDSAVYTDAATDPATGDTSGVRITFWQAGDGIDGSTAPVAAGAVGQSEPLAGIRLLGRDSLELEIQRDVASAPDTIHFAGRADCDSLQGRQLTRRGTSPSEARYRRVH
jgi:hypothetical protein